MKDKKKERKKERRTKNNCPSLQRGTTTRGALRCFQRALAALVACENEFSLTRWHKPCDD